MGLGFFVFLGVEQDQRLLQSCHPHLPGRVTSYGATLFCAHKIRQSCVVGTTQDLEAYGVMVAATPKDNTKGACSETDRHDGQRGTCLLAATSPPLADNLSSRRLVENHLGGNTGAPGFLPYVCLPHVASGVAGLLLLFLTYHGAFGEMRQ
jgi:hypothetical protein